MSQNRRKCWQLFAFVGWHLIRIVTTTRHPLVSCQEKRELKSEKRPLLSRFIFVLIPLQSHPTSLWGTLTQNRQSRHRQTFIRQSQHRQTINRQDNQKTGQSIDKTSYRQTINRQDNLQTDNQQTRQLIDRQEIDSIR